MHHVQCPSFDSKRLECIGQMTCPGQVYQYAEHSGGTAAASSAVGEQRNLSSQTEIMWHIHSVLGIPFDRQVDICKYHGIKCFQQQVVSVDLTARECGDDSLSDDENELENEDEEMSMCAIPSDIGNFMHLEYLRLRGFDGTIPIELGNLRKIKYLDIADNDLTGTIPRNLFKRLDILRQADLSDNVLSGTIPDSLFWHDRKLESLNLSDNQLTGSIPERISLLTSLKEFRMSNNQIGGKIPSFANLQKLEDLQLQQNYLKGTIPSWLSDNRSLKRIDLHDNYLTGSIPVPLARIAHLQILNLSINSFTGTFPRGVAAIPSLNQLDVSSNFLSGEIPSELGRNRRLSKLVLHSNMFTGTVPEALCKNTRLNRGTTLRYGCNGIVCAAGTYNEKQGYGMCKPCLYANDMPFLGSSRCEGLNEERALKYFYNFMGGEGWDAKWSSDDWTGYDDEYSDVCNWYGVTCGKDGSIVGLEFPLHTDAL